jgi:hypothetical protein
LGSKQQESPGTLYLAGAPSQGNFQVSTLADGGASGETAPIPLIIKRGFRGLVPRLVRPAATNPEASSLSHYKMFMIKGLFSTL